MQIRLEKRQSAEEQYRNRNANVSRGIILSNDMGASSLRMLVIGNHTEYVYGQGRTAVHQREVIQFASLIRHVRACKPGKHVHLISSA